MKKLVHLFGMFLDEELKEPINEALEPEKSQIRPSSYSLPTGFVWDTLDLEDPTVVCYEPISIPLCQILSGETFS